MKVRSLRYSAVALLVAALAGVAPSAASAAPPKLLKIKIGQPAVTGSLLYYIAQQKGFLAQQGLEAEIMTTMSPSVYPQALTTGDVTVASITLPALAQLRQRGAQFKTVTAKNFAPTLLIVAPKSSGIPVSGENGATWQDVAKALVGKRIAGFGVGTIQDLLLQTMFKLGDLPPRYTVIPATSTGAQLAVLQTNQADALVVGAGVAYTAQLNGLGRIVMNFADKTAPPEISNMAFGGQVASDKFIKKNPDFPKRYRTALNAAQTWIINPKNRREVLALNQKFTGLSSLDPGTALGIQYDSKYFAGFTGFTVKGVQRAIDLMLDTGQLNASPMITPKDIVDPAVMH